MTHQTACPFTRHVDDHFSGRISPSNERALRTHLPTCTRCHAYYGRHLLLSHCDPSALSAQTRLARGLGLHPPAPSIFRWPVLAPLSLAGAALVLGLLLVKTPATDSEFMPRGAATHSAQTQLLAFRIPPAATTCDSASCNTAKPVARVIAPTDELAFAYRNPNGYQHLMVFGVDDQRRVFWYHPAWTEPGTNPSGIPITPTHTMRELPEAIRHPLQVSRLLVYGVFMNEPLTVEQVEERVRRAPTPFTVAFPEAEVVTVELEVAE